MNHTAEELLQVPASDVVLPGVAQSGWLSKQSDWLKTWNVRWLVLWPVGQPTASQLSRGDSLGFHAAAEGGMNAHGFWLLVYDSPSSSKPRRVVLLQPGTFDLAVNEEDDQGHRMTGAKPEKHLGPEPVDVQPGKRAVLELTVRESVSSSLLPTRAQERGGTTLRLSCESSKTLRIWARAISDILAPVRRGRLDSAGCNHRAPIMRYSTAPRTSSTVCAEEDHASWRNIAARLRSPQTQNSCADGPGTESTIRLPVLDFGQQPPPDSPVDKKVSGTSHDIDGRKRAQNEQSDLKHQEQLSCKRIKLKASAKPAISGRNRLPMNQVNVNQSLPHCEGVRDYQ